MSEQLLKELLSEVKGIKSDITEMKKDITDMKSDITNMKSDITNMKSDITNMKSDIKLLRHDVDQLKIDTKRLRQDVDIMKPQLQENTEITKAIHHRQEETDARLESLSMDVAKAYGEISAVKESVNVIEKNMATKEDLEFYDMKISKHEREIFKIKHGA